ncbi:hypothetical protein EXW62_27360 (plasmid) [Bacillus mycoides]|uniref:hypothetical protein n=1 Tax=Bacillus mycoides TaxID=1405 RepID=UPI001C033CFE|nr:hypothetical protein [Bacillus mycoides]QWH20721.1 hypothetical protein EXW62_27360 [Bacillus mycoides]
MNALKEINKQQNNIANKLSGTHRRLQKINKKLPTDKRGIVGIICKKVAHYLKSKYKNISRKIGYLYQHLKRKIKLWIYYLMGHFKIVTFVVVIIGIWVYVQTLLYGKPLDKTFWLSLIPNPVMTALGILISTYFVNIQTKSNEQKKQKKILKEIFGDKLCNLTKSIMFDYVCFLSNAEEYRLTHGREDKLVKYFNELSKDASTIITYDRVISDIKINVENVNFLNGSFIKDWNNMRYEVDLMMHARGMEMQNPVHIPEDSFEEIERGRDIQVDRIQFIKGLNNSVTSNIDAFMQEFEFVLPLEIKSTLHSIKHNLAEQEVIYQGIENFRLVYNERAKKFIPDLHQSIVQHTEKTSEDILFLWKYFRI